MSTTVARNRLFSTTLEEFLETSLSASPGTEGEPTSPQRESVKEANPSPWEGHEHKATSAPPQGGSQANLSRRERYKKSKNRPQPFAKKLQQEPGESWAEFKSRCLFSLLVKEGLRILNKNPEALKENLLSLLLDYLPEACEVLDLPQPVTSYEISTGSASKTWLTWANLERIAKKAADTTVENWDSAYVDRHREMSRRGGSVKAYTLKDYLATSHLSRREAMEALGVSESTVKRMRRLYGAHSAEELALLIEGENLEDERTAEHADPARVRDGAGSSATSEGDGVAPQDARRSARADRNAPRPSGCDDGPLSVGVCEPSHVKQEIGARG
jgi:hypothetical protein